MSFLSLVAESTGQYRQQQVLLQWNTAKEDAHGPVEKENLFSGLLTLGVTENRDPLSELLV